MISICPNEKAPVETGVFIRRIARAGYWNVGVPTPPPCSSVCELNAIVRPQHHHDGADLDVRAVGGQCDFFAASLAGIGKPLQLAAGRETDAEHGVKAVRRAVHEPCALLRLFRLWLLFLRRLISRFPGTAIDSPRAGVHEPVHLHPFFLGVGRLVPSSTFLVTAEHHRGSPVQPCNTCSGVLSVKLTC